jgi:hypothetical protein
VGIDQALKEIPEKITNEEKDLWEYLNYIEKKSQS